MISSRLTPLRRVQYTLKNHIPSSIPGIEIRPLSEGDARHVRDLIRDVLQRCNTTLTSAEEFSLTEEQEREHLLKFSNSPNRALGAFRSSSLIGVVFLTQLPNVRIQHRGSIGISVHPDSWSCGIGTQLLRAVLTEAKQRTALRRIEASILANNPASERLFRSAGFSLEGVRHEAAFIDGTYIDEKLFVSRLE